MKTVVLLSAAIAACVCVSFAQADNLTFTEDVAPVVFKHRAWSHRPSEIDPLSPLNRKDAAKRSTHLAEIVAERHLPPRLIEPRSYCSRDEDAATPVMLPSGGFPLPAEAKLLREKYDLDKDGKLSQKELEAIPQPLRGRVENMIRKRLAKDNHAAEASEGRTELLPAPRVVKTTPQLVPDDVTFAKDVAPILFEHCAACHRPGEVGPFSLLTYSDAAKRAKQLAEVATERRMPPWLPEPGPHQFLDDRRLTDTELAILARWARSGAKAGDSVEIPAPPRFTEGWQLGKPDLVIKMPKPFVIPADGPDVYQAFVISIPIDDLKWVKGFEFRPGNRKVVHHANILLDGAGKLRERAEKENGPGFRTNSGIEARQLATGALGGWRPGTTARFMLDGFSRPVRKGTDLVFNMHYHPSGKVEEDQSCIGLYFSDKPGQKRMYNLSMFVSPNAGNERLLDIPAGDKHFHVSLTKTVPADAVVYWVTPHAHYLLKEMTLKATFPDGRTSNLLEIKNWDFNQQDIYYYAEPVKLPKGTSLHLSGYYDNSADNPQNPSTPPLPVRWGERTTDEMFAAVLGFVPDGDTAAEKYRQIFAWRNKDAVAVKAAKDGLAKPLSLPPEGFALPNNADLLRRKYDLNKDGRLSQQELNSIPQPLRSQVEEMIRRRLAADAKTPVGNSNPR